MSQNFITGIDIDGVLADFNGYFEHHHGITPNQAEKLHGTDALWAMIAKIPDFWAELPLMPGAMELWNTVKPYNPIILSGCPRATFDEAAAGKRKWVAKHFGAVPVITCLSKEKHLYMVNPGDILIDDRKSNVKKWLKAGGRAIYFKDAQQAIAEFKQMVSEAA